MPTVSIFNKRPYSVRHVTEDHINICDGFTGKGKPEKVPCVVIAANDEYIAVEFYHATIARRLVFSRDTMFFVHEYSGYVYVLTL